MRLILLAALSIFFSCRAIENQSETASIENFTAKDDSKIVKNVCRGPYENKEYGDMEFIEAPTKELEDITRQTLQAIPLSIRENFSTKLIGKVKIASNAATLCQKLKKDLSESRLDTGALNTNSCLIGEEGVPGVELVIPANKDSIRHSLVRAYFAAFFTTMAASDYNEDLELFTAALKSSDLIEIENDVYESLQKDLQGKTARRTIGKSVDAVIEAADQYYCSPETREVFRTQYTHTYQSFKKNFVSVIHEDGEKNPEEILGELRSQVSQRKSFQLRRRWGRRPLRSWGRSRMSARRAGGRGAFPAWNLHRRRARSAGGRGLFPAWNLGRRQAYEAGGQGAFPAWNLSRKRARSQLRSAGYPGNSLFPNYWANRLVR